MAIATFDRAYLASVSDLTTRISFGTGGKAETEDITGEVREMANGGLRAVSRLADRRGLDVTAVYIDDTMRAQIRAWRGQVVLYRDMWGRVIYGVYWGIKPKGYRDGHWDVTFSLQKVTYDPNVVGTQFAV